VDFDLDGGVLSLVDGGFDNLDDGDALALSVAYPIFDGTDANDGPLAVDDGPVSATEGAATGAIDVLGNDSDAEGDPLTIGCGDAATALGGLEMDVFDFSASTANGVRETRRIGDYAAGELIDIGEAVVGDHRERGARVTLFLDGGRDVIVVNGVGDFDAIAFA